MYTYFYATTYRGMDAYIEKNEVGTKRVCVRACVRARARARASRHKMWQSLLRKQNDVALCERAC